MSLDYVYKQLLPALNDYIKIYPRLNFLSCNRFILLGSYYLARPEINSPLNHSLISTGLPKRGGGRGGGISPRPQPHFTFALLLYKCFETVNFQLASIFFQSRFFQSFPSSFFRFVTYSSFFSLFTKFRFAIYYD